MMTYLSHGHNRLLGIRDGGFSTASDDLLVVHHTMVVSSCLKERWL
jgi:hypothetical protein